MGSSKRNILEIERNKTIAETLVRIRFPARKCHLKQRHVLRQKLCHVDIHQRPQQQNALHLIRVLQLQVPRGSQHRLHRPHAVVVVMLGGQLLRAQTVGGHDLLGQTVGENRRLSAEKLRVQPRKNALYEYFAQGIVHKYLRDSIKPMEYNEISPMRQ